jgi:3-isopropylmalate dehydrogenase
MLLRYSLRQPAAAVAIEGAIARALAEGARTKDIARDGEVVLGTRAMGERIAALVG